MNEFQCENFLTPVDPNEAGYVQSKNFLRQWYVHGPFPMAPETRAAAEAGRWDGVLDTSRSEPLPFQRRGTLRTWGRDAPGSGGATCYRYPATR